VKSIREELFEGAEGQGEGVGTLEEGHAQVREGALQLEAVEQQV
jgi:hypothetical protein